MQSSSDSPTFVTLVDLPYELLTKILEGVESGLCLVRLGLAEPVIYRDEAVWLKRIRKEYPSFLPYIDKIPVERFFVTYRLLSGYLSIHSRNINRKCKKFRVGDYYRASAPLSFPSWIPTKSPSWLPFTEFFSEDECEGVERSRGYDQKYNSEKEALRDAKKRNKKNEGYNDHLIVNIGPDGQVLNILHRVIHAVPVRSDYSPKYVIRWKTEHLITFSPFPLPARSVIVRWCPEVDLIRTLCLHLIDLQGYGSQVQGVREATVDILNTIARNLVFPKFKSS